MLYFQLTKTEPVTVFTDILRSIRTLYGTDDPQKEGLILKQLMDTVSGYKTAAFFDSVITHATNALIVAGILLIFVEHRRMKLSEEEHKTQKRDLVANVWRGISNLLIPDKIVEQLQALLDYKVIRTNCIYTITFKPLPDDIPEGIEYIVVQRALRFFALNISEEPVEYPFKPTIVSTESNLKKKDGSPFPLVGHTQFIVDGEDFAEKATLSSDGTTLTYSLELLPGTPREIYTVNYEVKRASDSNFYTQSIALTDLEITLENRIGERLSIEEVIVHHPQKDELHRDRFDPNHYYFQRAILPGQSFSVTWRMDPIVP